MRLQLDHILIWNAMCPYGTDLQEPNVSLSYSQSYVFDYLNQMIMLNSMLCHFLTDCFISKIGQQH